MFSVSVDYPVAVVQTESGSSDCWARGPCPLGLNGVDLTRKLSFGLEVFDRWGASWSRRTQKGDGGDALLRIAV